VQNSGMTFNVIGMPVDEPLQAGIETLDFNLHLKPYIAWSSPLYPYPGTEIKRLSIEKGLLKNEISNLSISPQAATPLIFENQKTKQQLINLSHLFGIIVQSPFLRPFTYQLIALPATRIYLYLFYIFFGFKMYRPKSITGYIKTMGHYFKFYLNYMKGLR